MEAEGEERSFSLHALVASHKLNFGEGKGVSEVERSVHVRVGHTSKELGVLFSQFFHGVIGFFGGTVDLPYFVVLPDLLVPFLDCHGGISLSSLFKGLERRDRAICTSLSCLSSTMLKSGCRRPGEGTVGNF